MTQDNGDDFVDSLVIRDFTHSEAREFDAAEIDFVRRHPEVLAKLSDPLEMKRRYLLALLGLAISMAVVAKIVDYTNVTEGHEVVDDLLTNVLFSVSIELLGAATVAFLLELVFERRLRRNQDLLARVMGERSQAIDPE